MDSNCASKSVIDSHGKATGLYLFDGWMDNIKELSDELGVPKKPESVLEAAWNTWEWEFLRKLKGDFVFSVCHLPTNTYVCGASPLSFRKIFFRSIAGALVVGPDAFELARAVNTGWTLNERFLAGYMLWGHFRNVGVSPFEGVKRIRRGEIVILDKEGPRTRRYWNWCDLAAIEKERGEHIECIHAALREATRPQPSVMDGISLF